ncbi:signal peptidase II [Azospirillum agricola]|uniref:signal peptidase II n=1 Tax=Azospirillum agricola TaxID=1720247 RepID=UPI000A0F2E50|nr:signal peptidase II [Azospirillum agricola]SMH33090.1 signal peptidase II Aspartic peptidase. MEROPS family A08 [Azospirillum lipoferum]
MPHRPALPGLRVTLAVAAFALAADQLSKWAILAHVLNPPRTIPVTPFFNLTLGFNTGISFGLLGGEGAFAPALLAGAALLVAAGLMLWAIRLPDRPLAAAGGAVAGGALGNVVDRLRQGAVTDFLDLHAFGWHWPTFNVADVLIVGGAAAIALRTPREPGRPALRAGDPSS